MKKAGSASGERHCDTHTGLSSVSVDGIEIALKFPEPLRSHVLRPLARAGMAHPDRIPS
jgi:hypothetical protein